MEFTWFVVLVSVVALLLIVVKFMTLCKKCDNQTVVLLKGLANKVQIVHTCIHILEARAHAMPVQILLGKRVKEENLQLRLLDFIGL